MIPHVSSSDHVLNGLHGYQNVTMTQLVNVVDLSVDVGDNTSVLDTLNLTFVYDNISGTKKKGSKTPRDNRVSIGAIKRADLR